DSPKKKGHEQWQTTRPPQRDSGRISRTTSWNSSKPARRWTLRLRRRPILRQTRRRILLSRLSRERAGSTMNPDDFETPPDEEHWAGEPPWPTDKNARAVTDDAD